MGTLDAHGQVEFDAILVLEHRSPDTGANGGICLDRPVRAIELIKAGQILHRAGTFDGDIAKRRDPAPADLKSIIPAIVVEGSLAPFIPQTTPDFFQTEGDGGVSRDGVGWLFLRQGGCRHTGQRMSGRGEETQGE